VDEHRGEQWLRTAVHGRLLSRARTALDTRVIDELGVLNGQYRIDIAVVNGHIRGIELKSREDTLDRLTAQIKGYGRVVDFATLVVDERHLERAQILLPNWWGLVAVASDHSKPRFKRLRPERANRAQNGFDIARLLWKREAVELLEQISGEAGWNRKRRHELYETIAKRICLRRLRGEVRNVLKKRANWRDPVPHE
jgi:hypothetical protein